MSTPPETAGGREDGAGQHDVGRLETSEAWGNVEECIARDRLLLEDPRNATELANLRAQRKCQVCFDLDIPYRFYYEYSDYTAKELELDPSTYSQFEWDGFRIPLALLESTAKAGCPSCKLLREILRTQPETGVYLDNDEDWHSVWIHPRTYPILQSHIIVIESPSDNSPDICFYLEPRCKPTSVRLKPSLNHPWPTSRPSPSDVVAFVKPRLAKCLSSHPKCSTTREGQGSTGYLPTRVIAVLDDKGSAIDPVLIQTDSLPSPNDESRRYIALSHCWGQSQPIKTTTENYEEHLKSISWSALPQTFQDTVLVVRALGVRFLWIDSLCIVQDNRADWANEASMMAEVYANSWLTIAATSAADGTQGLFMDRPGIEKLQTSDGELSVVIRPIFKSDLRLSIEKEHLKDTSFPLLSRGWALQEHLLSKRVLHFTRDELLFECHSSLCCECDPVMVPDAIDTSKCHSVKRHSLGGIMRWYLRLKTLGFLSWYSTIRNYSCRRLTYDSDILPALSGIAKEYQRHAAPDLGRYLAGLWENDLLYGLLWYTHYPTAEVPRRRERDNLSSPPSWSWTYISSPVRWAFVDAAEDDAEVLHVSCNQSTADDKGMVTGGRLTLRGKLGLLTIQYTAGDLLPTIFFRDADGERYPLAASMLEPDDSDDELNDGLYLDIPLSSTSEAARGRSEIVLYCLPLLYGYDTDWRFGILIQRLPERSECNEEEDRGNTSPHLFERVGHFQFYEELKTKMWSGVEDTIVTII